MGNAIIIAAGAVIAAVITAIATILTERQTRFYETRTASDEGWFRDMKRSQDIVFIGISHEHLQGYLHQLLTSISQDSPLRSLQIIYASDDNGKMWNGAKFIDNLMESRQKIASRLSDPDWRRRFPNYESVSFLQSTHLLPFGGCVMDPDKGSARVIYVVNYLPMQLPDAKQTLTFRYSSYISRWLTKKSSNLINVYADSYQAIVNKAKRLGTFKESLWDRSVTEWQVFSEKCRAHRDSMRHLINFARLRGDERVIDVAAGTGHVSKIILETHASVSLTVLDASPRMIGMCRNVLGHDAQYALCKVPPSVNEVAIDLRDSYDFIVIHLSLSAVAATADKLSELALWCKRYLKPSGKVVLSAHNTAVDLQSLFSVDNDPLRQAIRDELKRMELASVYRPVYRKSFTRSDIESAFERAGYVCEAKEQQSFPMQMEDRILLWSAPVVLNEIVEVSQLSEQQIREVLDNTARRLDNQPTPDMTVMYWRFSLLQR